MGTLKTFPQPTNQYLDGLENAPLEKKAARIFELEGYEVEHNRRFTDFQIDIFIKQKKTVSSEYESWVCLVDKGNQKVRKKAIDKLFHILKAARKELAKESNLYTDCQAMFISENGFTKGAIEAGKEYSIELRTLKLLFDDFKAYMTANEKLHREFVELIQVGFMAKTFANDSQEMAEFLKEIRSYRVRRWSMSLSEKEAVEKILSFNLKELSDWIKSRLHGYDRYFHVFEGVETNLSKFIGEAFHHIVNQGFRDNLTEILDDLITELDGWTADQAKENKEYVYELLSLCGVVKEFENRATLYRIAESGKLKGVNAYERDLHLMLLRLIASLRAAGDYEFWGDQMYDESNQYYANVAFYALLGRGYRLGLIFKHIGAFIHRSRRGVDIQLGISALINVHGKEEIIKRFKEIGDLLSREQKEAVNNAFINAKYDPVYQLGVG